MSRESIRAVVERIRLAQRSRGGDPMFTWLGMAEVARHELAIVVQKYIELALWTHASCGFVMLQPIADPSHTWALPILCAQGHGSMCIAGDTIERLLRDRRCAS